MIKRYDDVGQARNSGDYVLYEDYVTDMNRMKNKFCDVLEAQQELIVKQMDKIDKMIKIASLAGINL